MINIFSFFIGILLYVELVTVVVLLKPYKEPYIIRDFWCSFLEKFGEPSIVVAVVFFSLIVNTFMEFFWERIYYDNLLKQVNDPNLVLEFYWSKMSMCYTCFFMALFLYILIERLAQFLIRIARLLEFELMCRHAILMKDYDHESITFILSQQKIRNAPNTEINVK